MIPIYNVFFKYLLILKENSSISFNNVLPVYLVVLDITDKLSLAIA